MSRFLAIPVWLTLMIPMYLFMQWGMRYKAHCVALGVPLSKAQILLITLSDILANYWYIPAAIVLILCLAFSGKEPKAESPQ